MEPKPNVVNEPDGWQSGENEHLIIVHFRICRLVFKNSKHWGVRMVFISQPWLSLSANITSFSHFQHQELAIKGKKKRTVFKKNSFLRLLCQNNNKT